MLVLAGGIGVGIDEPPYLSAAKKRRTESITAGSRILAGIKSKHEEAILAEACCTTEAIKGELDKSRQTLRRTLNAVMIPTVAESPQPKPIILLPDPVKSGQSPS